ncbi:MAG: iron ABC transporter permease, partial [Deinococcus sp.]|nr:iron ABC transporter permease [Deinococcus sp.]
ALAALAVGLGLALFLVYPVAAALRFPSLAHYAGLWHNPRWISATVNTLIMTALATGTATTVGFLMAYAVTRTNVPWRGFFSIIAILPLFSPPFMVSYAYRYLLFGPNGFYTNTLLNKTLHLVDRRLSLMNWDWLGFGGWPLWAVETAAFFPLAFLVISGVLRAIPQSLEYAARNLGAAPGWVFWTVTFPLARPGVAGAGLLVAIYILADFGNPLILTKFNFPLLATEAYDSLVSDAASANALPNAAVLASALIVPALVLFFLQRFWVSRRLYTTIGGKGSQLPAPPTPALVRWGLFGCCLVVSLLVLSVYGAILSSSLVRSWGRTWQLDLRHWILAMGSWNEVRNSLVFALFTGVIATGVALLAAYLTARQRFLGRGLMDFLAILPAAIPGIFLGLGYRIAFGGEPFELYGTAAIIVLAFVFWNVPLGYQAGLAGFAQIERHLEQAAHNLGASSLRAFWDVDAPLLKPAFISSFVVAFVRAITTLSVAIFLVTPQWRVTTVIILDRVNSGEYGVASALTSLLLFLTLGCFGLARLALGRQLRVFT